MKITILTYGSRGDVEPLIALGEGLTLAGHRVRLAAPGVFSSLPGNTEIDYVELPGEPQKLVKEFVDVAGRNQLQMVRAMSNFVLPLAAKVGEQARMACEDTDLIIHSFLFTSLGYELAHQQGVPDISALLFPVFSNTCEFPAPTFPNLPLGGTYRRLTHWIVSQIFWQGSRFLYQVARRNCPAMPPLTSWPFDEKNAWQTPILYGFSHQVVPRPRDWNPRVHITGYWFSNRPGNWDPDKNLLDFIHNGPAPIAIAFGSTVSRKLRVVYEMVLEALARTQQRGIIVGPGLHHRRDPSPEVFRIDDVPYEWLFGRCGAIIHHGGAGTTGKGLMAGVPNIVLPFTSDQPFWGNRVHSLGVGPKPIPPHKLSVKLLADTIDITMKDEGTRARARYLGESMRREDGVLSAVEIIEKYAGMKTS